MRFRALVCWLVVLVAAGIPAIAQVQAAKDARINNENTRHQSVLNEMSYRRADALREYQAGVKICVGDTKCVAAQKANYTRTLALVATETKSEDAQHALILHNIELAYPEIMTSPGQPSSILPTPRKD